MESKESTDTTGVKKSFMQLKGTGQNIIIDGYESMNRTCDGKNGIQCFSSTSK